MSKQLLRVSYLQRKNRNWHVWAGQATSKLSAYRQYAKQCRQNGQEPENSGDLILKQYGAVRKLSRGYWVDCYR